MINFYSTSVIKSCGSSKHIWCLYISIIIIFFLRQTEKQYLLKYFRKDVAHLSLYNLSVIHKKKYFDSEMDLMVYINDNWELLQLGEVRISYVMHQ